MTIFLSDTYYWFNIAENNHKIRIWLIISINSCYHFDSLKDKTNRNYRIIDSFDLLNKIHKRGEWKKNIKQNRLLVSDSYKMSTSKNNNEQFNKKWQIKIIKLNPSFHKQKFHVNKCSRIFSTTSIFLDKW